MSDNPLGALASRGGGRVVVRSWNAASLFGMSGAVRVEAHRHKLYVRYLARPASVADDLFLQGLNSSTFRLAGRSSAPKSLVWAFNQDACVFFPEVLLLSWRWGAFFMCGLVLRVYFRWNL